MKYLSNCFSFLDYICHLCTFYFCKFTGVLPSHVNGESFSVHSLFHNVAGLLVEKTVSQAVYPFGFLFIIVNASLVASFYYIEDNTANPFRVYIALINSTPAYLIILISVFARRHSTVRCVYSASLRYCMSSAATKSCGFIFVSVVFYFLVFLCGYIVSLYTVDNILSDFSLLLIFEFSFSPLFATSLLLSSFCLITERMFSYINGQLREISKMQYPEKTISQIKILMFYHEVATDLVEETNVCFRYDLVTLLLDFTYQLIVFSYTIALSSQKNINSIIIIGLLYSVRLFKFIIVCSCSQRIYKQVNLLRVHIQSIKVNHLHRLDPTTELVLTDFSKAVNARSAILTASGFTDIDFNLVFKLTGTAMMYACAALQYKGLTK